MASTPSNKMPDSTIVRSDPEAIRQSFRVPVEFQDDSMVKINHQTIRVVDISPDGLNVAGTGQVPFAAGQLIEECELRIMGSRISNLTARIVHCAGGPDGNWNSGLQWIDLGDDVQEQIAAVVSKIKKRLRKNVRE